MNIFTEPAYAAGGMAGLVLSTFLALLWAVAAAHKLLDWAVFRAQLDDYRLLPRPVVPVATGLLPALEATAAVFWLMPGARMAASALSAGLFLLYASAMGINLMRGRRHLDCGCGGSAQAVRPALVGRNLILAMLAVLAGQCPPIGHGLQMNDWITIAGAALTLFGLYAACNQLLANNPAQRRTH